MTIQQAQKLILLIRLLQAPNAATNSAGIALFPGLQSNSTAMTATQRPAPGTRTMSQSIHLILLDWPLSSNAAWCEQMCIGSPFVAFNELSLGRRQASGLGRKVGVRQQASMGPAMVRGPPQNLGIAYRHILSYFKSWQSVLSSMQPHFPTPSL